MHASIWKFSGDPGAPLERYDAMLAEIGAGNLRLHICLRAEDGIVLVDTCPSKEAYEAFAHGDAFRELRERHGLPEPSQLDDYAVHLAYASGLRCTPRCATAAHVRTTRSRDIHNPFAGVTSRNERGIWAYLTSHITPTGMPFMRFTPDPGWRAAPHPNRTPRHGLRPAAAVARPARSPGARTGAAPSASSSTS